MNEVGFSVTALTESRQFGQALAGLFPDVVLDFPTVMAILMVFAFAIQFMWTSLALSIAQSSASSSTTTTTTTTTTASPAANPAAADATSVGIIAGEEALLSTVTSSSISTSMEPRTQTVTPAPAPAWRYFSPGWNPDAEIHWYYSKSQDPYLYPSDQFMIKGLPQMSLEYDPGFSSRLRVRRSTPRKIWDPETPVRLSSHRILKPYFGHEVPPQMDNFLYTVQNLGTQLEDWDILTPDGGKAFSQSLLMLRCIMGSASYCSKLDHFYRRQTNLNKVAAMMNYGFPSRKDKMPKTLSKGGYFSRRASIPSANHKNFNGPYKARQPHRERRPYRGHVNNSSNHHLPSRGRTNRGRSDTRLSKDMKTSESRITPFSQRNEVVLQTPWNMYFFLSLGLGLVASLGATYHVFHLTHDGGGREASPIHFMDAVSDSLASWDNQEDSVK